MKLNRTWITKQVVCTLAICVQLASAKTINVEDHGVISGQDITHKLNTLIRAMQDHPDVTLVFPRGQNEFYPKNAREEHRAVSNHDNSLKH